MSHSSQTPDLNLAISYSHQWWNSTIMSDGNAGVTMRRSRRKGFRSRAISMVVLAAAFDSGTPRAAQSISSPEDRAAIAPRMLQSPRDASEYYPTASLRLDETGRVVLRFAVGASGKAIGPFTLDAEQSSNASQRLVAAAEEYLKDSSFDTRAPYKKMLLASFVFELMPCGTLEHSAVHDYTINLCRDRLPPPAVIMSNERGSHSDSQASFRGSVELMSPP
jgi:hypothetical protein